ncbi:MAG: aminotransferase class V-fold PLP-dependent enzyme [Clostridia bacterium]|nr:aminotransferase class V-fold PLP-dependent enzyme [Clostridia bacterium]
MKTPIYDFVRAYAAKNVARFHMPGHKGHGSLGCEALDITEIEGADALDSACGIIAESEQNATELFGTARTLYSTEGSSLSIKAMLALVVQNHTGDRPLILAARNVHRTFVYACALLDLDVEWIYPTEHEHLCSCHVTAEEIEKTLNGMQKMPAAVYLTSPDYLGQVADIQAIAKVCHARSIPLLVDNAHGAYLQFLSPSQHPIALGADLCCDSAHKTLPVLTGGAYLHISKNTDRCYAENAKNALALFASTSPSYLILQSLDLCNQYLSNGYRERLAQQIEKTDRAKQTLSQYGFTVEESEPLKIVINAKRSGYLGTELAELLRKERIECEFADADYLVLMLSAETRDEDMARLERAFGLIKAREPLQTEAVGIDRFPTQCKIREAILSPCETVNVKDARDRICAAPTVSCPPAIPVVVSGEIITDEAIRTLQKYGIEQISVVKKSPTV